MIISPYFNANKTIASVDITYITIAIQDGITKFTTHDKYSSNLLCCFEL